MDTPGWLRDFLGQVRLNRSIPASFGMFWEVWRRLDIKKIIYCNYHLYFCSCLYSEYRKTVN